MSADKLVLVDGSSYLFRAFHALPPLTNSAGDPTGAIHGVLNMLNKLAREEETQHFAVVFDASGKSFRNEIFSDYKATRPPMPDELRAQIEPIHDAIRAMGIPLLKVDGVEADDVIGTLCREAERAGMATLVSTSDKDLAQLVTPAVTLIDTMSGKVMDVDGVREKFGVDPEQIIDYLALIGDSSDNIPGVPKVGPKTAAKWLAEYGNIDVLIERAEEIKGKIGESLREHLEQLELSRTLATIKTDVELDCEPSTLSREPPDVAALKSLYEHFELRSLLAQLEETGGAGGEKNEGSAGAKGDAAEYETVLDKAALERWIDKLATADLVAFDTETTSLDYMEAELVGISVAVDDGDAAYIPVAHDYPGAPDQLGRDWVLERLKAYLEDPNAAKVGHHLKYDAHILKRYDIELAGMAFDTMLESYVLNSVATRHDMDSVARKYLGVETIHYEDVAGKGAKQLTFNQVDLEQAAPYAAEDADVTLRLHRRIWKELADVEPLRRVYEDIEQPLVPVLLGMEEAGVLIDRDMLRRQSSELADRMQSLEAEAQELAGRPFNLGSPKQLQEILFEERDLPVIRKTPKGQPSTAEDVLQELAAEFDLPRVILDYRSVSKLRSTYTDKLPEQISPSTGRVHTSYHQAVAATGRLSSTDPNLQNIPIRTPEGRRIRQAFVAPEGRVLMAADYSQIELRIMAHLSGDDGLLEAFGDGRDIHQATAAEVFATAPADVTADQRRAAKAINFGLMYGMSAFGLAKQLGITRGEADEYIQLYFERYPGVRRYMDATREAAHERGFVETHFGRRLYLPDINSKNGQRRQYAERSAINAPMQGTAADIIKRAMIAVDDWLTSSGAPATMIMQVHDELVFEIDADRVEEVQAGICERMSGAADLAVDLAVDANHGPNWDEAH